MRAWILVFAFSAAFAGEPPPQGCGEGAEPAAALECARERFYFAGAPVHPLIVRDLLALSSDLGDQIVAVNLNDSWDSNRYCCRGDFDFEDEDGTLRATLSDGIPECEDGCRISYARLGADDDGAQVLIVRQRTGGSGVFSSLLILRFRTQNLGLVPHPDGENYHVGGTRVLLEKIGEIPMGEGARAAVRLSGVTVEVRGENARMVRDK